MKIYGSSSLMILKRPNTSQFILLFQVTLLWSYLFLNILNIGELGVGLPILGLYVCVGFVVIFIRYVKFGLSFNKGFFIFLVLLYWIALRYLMDYDGTHELKQVMVGTTGGMLLFYVMGLVLHEGLEINSPSWKFNYAFLGFIYFIFVLSTLISFSGQMRADLLLLSDVDGAYQRPGNFISITFIVFSLIYAKANIRSDDYRRGISFKILSTVHYLGCFGLLLIESQILGSNSATAILIAIAIITLATCFLFDGAGVYKKYFHIGGRVFNLSRLFTSLFKYFIATLLLALFVLVLIFGYLEIDISQTRLFGFGQFESSSFNSRAEILSKWGIAQISYAPLFGNVNVAYLVTGKSGTTLHNFFPSVLASLGLFGFIIVLALFYFVLHRFYRRATERRGVNSVEDYRLRVLSFYSFLVILFLLLFANMTVGYSWPVIWFSVGFFAKSLLKCHNQKMF